LGLLAFLLDPFALPVVYKAKNGIRKSEQMNSKIIRQVVIPHIEQRAEITSIIFRLTGNSIFPEK
jgi:hypothetical protein